MALLNRSQPPQVTGFTYHSGADPTITNEVRYQLCHWSYAVARLNARCRFRKAPIVEPTAFRQVLPHRKHLEVKRDMQPADIAFSRLWATPLQRNSMVNVMNNACRYGQPPGFIVDRLDLLPVRVTEPRRRSAQFRGASFRTPICWAGCALIGPIRSGAPTSHICRCAKASCIWWRSLGR